MSELNYTLEKIDILSELTLYFFIYFFNILLIFMHFE